MRKYRGVFFDMDGTIADTLALHAEATRALLEKFGYPATDELVYGTVGDALSVVFEKCGIPTERHAGLAAALPSIYFNEMGHMLAGIRLEPGVLELFQWLREEGIPAAVVTNSVHPLVERILEQNGAGSLVDYSGATPDALDKRDRCLSVLARHGLPAAECLYVGDAIYDIHLARLLGMDICLMDRSVSWAADMPGLIAQERPTWVCEEFAGLRGVIAGKTEQ